MTVTNVLKVTAATVAVLFATGAPRAETKAEIDIGVYNAMSRFFAQDPLNRELAGKAAGILVFPHVAKGGVGIAGEYGEGALLVDGHPVAYYRIGVASAGATAGADQRSEVLLFMTQAALEGFRRSHGWIVGANAQVAVVSQRAGTRYDMKTLRKPILAFLFGEKGLIGDLSIDGARISMKTS